MPVKIKINWDNENAVSESVRIYRADSAFTSANLPPLLAEILGDVNEYEDLTTIEDQTYFYMLSAKLGDQEVFTECFDVLATLLMWYDTNIVVNISASNLAAYHALAGTATRSNMGASLSGSYKWFGGVLGGDGKIYYIPSSSTDILIIDPINQTATRSNMGASLSYANEWRGGVLGGDGKIYCIPYDASNILIIDPINQTATRSNMGASFSGSYKWCGGVLSGDGKIYCVPYFAVNILSISMNPLVPAPALKYCLSPHLNKF